MDDYAKVCAQELPGSLREMVAVIGLPAVLALVAQWGGVVVAVPKRPGPDHPLVTALGADGASRFCAHFGGELLSIPRAARALQCLRNRELVAAYDAGVSATSLARSYRITLRQVRRILGDPEIGMGTPVESGPGRQLRLDL